MKKIITLLLATGAFVTMQAQTTKDEARKVILGQPKNGGNSPSTQGRDIILGDGNNGGNDNRNYPSSTSRDAQINQVNREYDAKIHSIRNNGTLTQAEKERMIRQLEKDRARRIQQINKGNNGNDVYNDDDDNDNDNHSKKAKHNNGKHLGWEKGKGNPHKNGGKGKG
jgi:hypothetical protein